MTLQVPQDLQYSLLEFIAHINTENFDALPNDFVNLGFSPADKVSQLQSSGLTEGLAFAFRQLNKGGGPSKIRERMISDFRERYGADLTDDELRVKAREEMINRFEVQLKSEGVDVNGVTNVMEEMSRRNRELFKLPPYVLYVSRAFSTLEGIGLGIDQDYSILAECYPYLARRLMTDSSPRATEALRSMLTDGKGLSASKFFEMMDNFQEYTSSTTAVKKEEAGSIEARRALTQLLLAPEGNYLQDILLEEAAKSSDALAREAYSRIKNSASGRFVKGLIKAPKELSERLPGPLRGISRPLSFPYEVASLADNILAKNVEDEAALETMNTVWSYIEPRIVGNTSSPPLSSVASRLRDQLDNEESPLRSILVDEKIRKQAPAVLANLSRRFGATLLHRAADRLEETKRSDATSIGTTVASVGQDVARNLANRIAPTA